jgi:hypothetical protein
MRRLLLTLIAGTFLTLSLPSESSAARYYRGWGPSYSYYNYYGPRPYVAPYRTYRPIPRAYSSYPYGYPYGGYYYGGPAYYGPSLYYYY